MVAPALYYTDVLSFGVPIVKSQVRPPTLALHGTPRELDAERLAAVGQVLRRFRVVFNAVKTHFREIERRTGVGGAQMWALSLIAATPGLGIKALAAGMDIRQSTASNLVKGLIERGLVAPRRGQADRRTIELELLPPGQALLASAPGPFSGVLPDALARLDRATLERLHQDLGAVVDLLEADATAAQTLLADL